jgi:hypothetical protein
VQIATLAVDALTRQPRQGPPVAKPVTAGADTAGDRSETARGGSLKLAAAHAAAPVSQPSRSYNGGSPVGEGWLSLVVLGGWVADG